MKEEDIRRRDLFSKYLELSAIDAVNFFSDKSGYLTINCPACNSKDPIHQFEKSGFSFSQCVNCATLFCNPRPPLSQFIPFYQDSPSTSFWVNEFFSQVAEQRREKMFKPRAEFINTLLEGKSNLLIGDIGAGFGIFLEEFRKINPNNKLVAIEPSVEMAKICSSKGFSVIEDLIENIDESIYQFDVLISFELFEHLFNPKEFALKIKKLLKPGGILILTTLNGLGFDIQILWEKSKSVSPPHHLNFFNPNSLNILFSECGFSEVEVSTPGVLDWSILEGGIVNKEFDADRIWKTIVSIGSDAAKADLQSWISNNGFSSHMRLIAKK
jgi:SAM-dependent methyltransferase